MKPRPIIIHCPPDFESFHRAWILIWKPYHLGLYKVPYWFSRYIRCAYKKMMRKVGVTHVDQLTPKADGEQQLFWPTALLAKITTVLDLSCILLHTFFYNSTPRRPQIKLTLLSISFKIVWKYCVIFDVKKYFEIIIVSFTEKFRRCLYSIFTAYRTIAIHSQPWNIVDPKI